MPDQDKPFPETINFDYLKSNQFRVIHADGAFFAASGQGVTISFFAERQPIPRRITHRVNRDGSLGEELVDQRVVRDAVIRDTEIAVSMSLDTAKQVKEKLQEIIAQIDKLRVKEKG